MRTEKPAMSSTNTANVQQAPYRAPCTKCTELQVQLASALAKKPWAKYELYYPYDSCGDQPGRVIMKCINALGMISAILFAVLDNAGWLALLAWPIVPALVAAHCVSIRKIVSKE